MAEGTRMVREPPTLELVLKRNPVERLKREKSPLAMLGELPALIATGYADTDEEDLVRLKWWGPTTTSGLELVRSCDVLVVDVLVAPELVEEAPEDALVISRAGMKQEAVTKLIVAYGAAGLDVVRLKGGDPSCSAAAVRRRWRSRRRRCRSRSSPASPRSRPCPHRH